MSTAVEIRGEQWWSRLFGHRWFVYALVGLASALIAATVVFHFTEDESTLEPGLFGWTFAAVVLGALLTIRVSGNAVGPTLLMTGVVGAASGATVIVYPEGAAELNVLDSVVMGAGAIFYFTFLWLSAALLPLLFPTGHPMSRRWAALGWAGALALALAVVPTFFPERQCTQNALEGGCGIWASNPIGIPGLTALEYGGVGSIVFAVLLISMLGGIVSLIVRFRRSHGAEREQIKWVVMAFGLNAAILFGYELVWLGLLGIPEIPDAVWSVVLFLTWTSIPVAIAVGIFKYRLYEIDRIINRSIVYAIVVGLLGALFVAGAVWLPSLLPGDSSSLAVAASTLAVAALFNPLRKRAQGFVDRRFYRSRYNAQQVADEFSARLREQVDPDAVAAEWVDVVRTTMQPESVAVWVREGA